MINGREERIESMIKEFTEALISIPNQIEFSVEDQMMSVIDIFNSYLQTEQDTLIEACEAQVAKEKKKIKKLKRIQEEEKQQAANSINHIILESNKLRRKIKKMDKTKELTVLGWKFKEKTYKQQINDVNVGYIDLKRSAQDLKAEIKRVKQHLQATRAEIAAISSNQYITASLCNQSIKNYVSSSYSTNIDQLNSRLSKIQQDTNVHLNKVISSNNALRKTMVETITYLDGDCTILENNDAILHLASNRISNKTETFMESITQNDDTLHYHDLTSSLCYEYHNQMKQMNKKIKQANSEARQNEKELLDKITNIYRSVPSPARVSPKKKYKIKDNDSDSDENNWSQANIRLSQTMNRIQELRMQRKGYKKFIFLLS